MQIICIRRKYLTPYNYMQKTLKKHQHKNVNISVQRTQFPNLLVWNNPRHVDMPLEPISAIHIYQPLCSGRIWYQVIFKRSLIGLNSEFSFSKTSRLTKAEEPSLPYYFTHIWKENNWIHTFPKGIRAMWNAISLVQDLNSCRRVHFLQRKPLNHWHQSVP